MPRGDALGWASTARRAGDELSQEGSGASKKDTCRRYVVHPMSVHLSPPLCSLVSNYFSSRNSSAPRSGSGLGGVVLAHTMGKRCNKAGFALFSSLLPYPFSFPCLGPGISLGFAVIKVQQLHCRSKFEALILKESRGSLLTYFTLSCQNIYGQSLSVWRFFGDGSRQRSPTHRDGDTSWGHH